MSQFMAKKYEVCEIEGLSAELPVEIFELSDLNDVLSLEAWNEVLSDDDREALAPFLPEVEGEDLQEALQDLLSGFNIHFGNPKDVLFGMLISGLCQPGVGNFRKGLQVLQRRKHYHNVRDYHNKLVNRIYQMQKIWKLHRDKPFEEKLHFLKLPLKGESDHVQPQRKRKPSLSNQEEKKYGQESGQEEGLVRKHHKNGEQTPPSTLQPDASIEPSMDEVLEDLPPLGPMDKILGFSIVHLLSAVRTAFLKTRGSGLDEFEWLSVDDLTERIQDSPGDLRILSSKYPLRDLVQHSLSVLLTKAPPGTRLWKPFVQQKRQPPRDWSWCGVVPQEDEDFGEVHTEADFWGVQEKAFAKLRERLVVSVTSTNLDKSIPGGKKQHLEAQRSAEKGKVLAEARKSPHSSLVERIESMVEEFESRKEAGEVPLASQSGMEPLFVRERTNSPFPQYSSSPLSARSEPQNNQILAHQSLVKIDQPPANSAGVTCRAEGMERPMWIGLEPSQTAAMPENGYGLNSYPASHLEAFLRERLKLNFQEASVRGADSGIIAGNGLQENGANLEELGSEGMDLNAIARSVSGGLIPGGMLPPGSYYRPVEGGFPDQMQGRLYQEQPLVEVPSPTVEETGDQIGQWKGPETSWNPQGLLGEPPACNFDTKRL